VADIYRVRFSADTIEMLIILLIFKILIVWPDGVLCGLDVRI